MSSQAQPILKADTIIELGKHATKRVISCEIRVCNTGNERLIIKGALGNTGSVIGYPPKKPIAPGECDVVRVDIGTGKHDWSYTRYVKLISNAGEHNVQIKFHAVTLENQSNFAIEAKMLNADSLQLTLTGWFRTYGDCDITEPQIGLEKLNENGSWEIIRDQEDLMDCGAPMVLLNHRVYFFNIHKPTYPFFAPISPGIYRFFVIDRDHKKIFSEALTLK